MIGYCYRKLIGQYWIGNKSKPFIYSIASLKWLIHRDVDSAAAIHFQLEQARADFCRVNLPDWAVRQGRRAHMNSEIHGCFIVSMVTWLNPFPVYVCLLVCLLRFLPVLTGGAMCGSPLPPVQPAYEKWYWFLSKPLVVNRELAFSRISLVSYWRKAGRTRVVGNCCIKAIIPWRVFFPEIIGTFVILTVASQWCL